MDCISTGIEFLDRATGGFHRKKPYFVFGGSGTGKSILGLQYVTAGLERGESALYVCRERPEDLVQQAERLGFPLSAHVQAERLVLLEYDADFQAIVSQQGPEAVLDELAGQVDAEAVRRVVFDPIDPFFAGLDEEAELRTHLRAVARRLEDLGWTPLLLGDDATVANPPFVLRVFSEVCWGLCELRRETEGGGAGHQLLVYKMRNVSLERSRFPFRIGSHGIASPEADAPTAPKRASFARFRPAAGASAAPAPEPAAAEAAAPAAVATPSRVDAPAPAAPPQAVPSSPAATPAARPAARPAPAPPPRRPDAEPAEPELLDDEALAALERAALLRAGGRTAALPPPPKRPRVLVAAADTVLRRSVAEALGDEIELVEAGDGEAALRAAVARHPDLLLLHAALPRVNAAGVCRILRAHGGDAPLLFLAGAPSRPSDRARWLELGADDVLEAPFEAAELVVRSRRLLDRRGGVPPRWPQLDPAAEIQKLGPQRLDGQELEAHVSEAAARARAHGLPLALLGYEFRFVDGEGGARFVERFGEILAGAIRAGDALSRVSEKRLVAMLLDADTDGARRVLQRVHERARAEAEVARGPRGVKPKVLYRLLAAQPELLDGEAGPGSLLTRLYALPAQLIEEDLDDRPGEPVEKYPLLEAVFEALFSDGEECRSPLDGSRAAIEHDPASGVRWVEIGEFRYLTQPPHDDTPAGLRATRDARIVWVARIAPGGGGRPVARIEDGRVFRGHDT